MKRVIVMGSTGSIGTQALEIIAASGEMRVVGLSCQRNTDLLLRQAAAVGCSDLAVSDGQAARAAREVVSSEITVRGGIGAAAQLVREVEADVVLNAIVGFAGLESTLAALESRRPLALANKESLVCGGSMVRTLAASRGAEILPVDSEHSALYQLLAAAGREAVDSLVITGSGGPFRGWTSDDLAGVSREQALSHPTWSMGEKITVDSATLMNKGLEVIEAHHLFDIPYEQIEVIIHPQSVVHALVRMIDGALLAHLGMPDMRVPLAYALNYPDRAPVNAAPLELGGDLSLDFSLPDAETFPALRLAREAGERGDAFTCALNAANEVAVGAFLEGKVSFPSIWAVIDDVIEDTEETPVETYEEAVAIDERARGQASAACHRRRK
jgi:1-deoxy-D-xylulose-5-phosphate reductoisomerase